VDLFQFNDDFIAAIAVGQSDDDVVELFAEAIRAGADVLERRLISIAGREVASQARFVNGAFEIPLTQQQYDDEFGDVGEPPKANVRRAIIASSIQASREMSKVLSGD
jgi:hypothetical protein